MTTEAVTPEDQKMSFIPTRDPSTLGPGMRPEEWGVWVSNELRAVAARHDVNLDEIGVPFQCLITFVGMAIREAEQAARAEEREASSFADLRAVNTARDHEWNSGTERVSLSFRGLELSGEVGEACNIMKKLERERYGIRGSRASPEMLAEELADVIICVDLIAMDLGIDLGEAVKRKFDATSEKYGLATRFVHRARGESDNV